jgi:hypothetical protein
VKDYSGAFDPDFSLEQLDHALLAEYGRDIMLANHIHDRSALLPVALNFGLEAQTQIACDEWMSSSPIYNARNRKALNITGNDVSVALKGFQFDIGAPHNFLNFHYALVSEREGYFWTNTCGPFNHVMKMSGGDKALQKQICHHMEDPTFDATVIAVNPQMRCRPVFRPPVDRVPETGPCKWQVTIQDDIALAEDCPFLPQTARTLAANFQFQPLPQSDDGLADYSGEFLRDMCLEKLSHSTLVTMCKEFMLDVFLLNYACYNAIAERLASDQIIAMAQAQYHHLAPVTVHRIRNAFAIRGDDIDAILKVLQLNPFAPRDYFDLGFARVSDQRGLVWLKDCAGYREPVRRGIAALMVDAPGAPGFDKLVQEVNPHAVVNLVDPSELAAWSGDADVKLAWEIVFDSERDAPQRSDYADMIGDAIWDHDNSRHIYLYDKYDAMANG